MAATKREQVVLDPLDPPATPPTSPARVALAEAIAGRDNAERRLDTIKAVRASNEERRFDLRAKLGALTEQIAKAKEQSADRLVNQALGEDVGQPVSVPDMESEAASIQTDLDTSQDLDELLAKRQREIENHLSLLGLLVTKRAQLVLGAGEAIARIKAEFEARVKDLHDLRSVIDLFVRQGYLETGLWQNESHWNWPTPRQDAWYAAAVALERDANAPLPES